MAALANLKTLSAGLALSTLLALAGCAPTSNPTFTPHAGPVKLVTSVAVWANIAKQLGGPLVSVRSVIHTSMQDPHSYTATARDQLLVNQADVTLANGLGYDDFFNALTEAAPNLDPRLKLHAWCAAECSLGVTQGQASSLNRNPHLWYHLASVEATAQHLTQGLKRALPTAAHEQQLDVRAKAFEGTIQKLSARETRVRKAVAGKNVLLTEGFAAYLVADLGLRNLTPAEFRNAVEAEQDASPRAMNRIHELLASDQISVLITNRQTATAQTGQLIAWARAANVPVLHLSESLPQGASYQSWMAQNIDAIFSAVAKK